jgi:hypothetical protein
MHVSHHKNDPIDSFLQLQRAGRLSDYLDPIDETAFAALSRRLSWAVEHANDPVHGDEASFLLDHAAELKLRLRREVGEAERAAASSGTEVDDLGDVPATVELTREQSPYQEQYDLHFGGIMRVEDLSEPPTQPRAIAPAALSPPVEPSYGSPRSMAATDDATVDSAESPSVGTADPAPVVELRGGPASPARAGAAVNVDEPSDVESMQSVSTSVGAAAEGQPTSDSPTPVSAHQSGAEWVEVAPEESVPEPVPEPFEEPGTPNFHHLREGIRQRTGSAERHNDEDTRRRLRLQGPGDDSSRSPLYALGLGVGVAVLMLFMFFLVYL